MSKKSGSGAFPRGIAPDLLISQVRNTMPYLFDADSETAAKWNSFPPAQVVRRLNASLHDLSHFEYFRLCLSAHDLTCGTPVPTDVDNQIRLKLWPRGLPLETAIEMTDLVLESRAWDFTLVSSRFVEAPSSVPEKHRRPLSGHLGEWFTVACGAYCALGQYSSAAAASKRDEVLTAIADEVEHHSEVFGALWRGKDGVGCLKAASSIAHNFGDLDRVMDMWELPVEDPLRLRFYKLSARAFDSEKKLRYLGRLWVAGELYKTKIEDGRTNSSSLALENHRHFALRKPRVLRSRPEFTVPTAPFFDEWGAILARTLTREEEIGELIETLRLGWDRQPGTIAYGRALVGMITARPELAENTFVVEAMRNPFQRKVLETSKEKFESTWAEAALAAMDEIPSRAQ